MLVSITALYAAILAILVTALAINVTVHRVKLRVPIGDGDNPQMLRMIRLHGNAAEYVPLALVLMLIYEINGGLHVALHIAGIALLAGRLLHIWGMWSTSRTTFGRASGQSLTDLLQLRRGHVG
jgi:uncharacterized membrane protein YecN with MAPEG domain